MRGLNAHPFLPTAKAGGFLGALSVSSDAPSLFEEMFSQAVPAWELELPGDDGDLSWTVIAPSADGVCVLDDTDHPCDVILALLGDDVGDEVLDALEPLPWSRTVATARDLREHFALATLPAGMWAHIVERIDLYGEAMESDLSDRGHDLLAWFRGVRPWPQLLRLVDRLPEGSRFQAAVVDDEDLARERVQAGAEPPAGKALPPLEGETQDRALLRMVVSLLMRVEHAVYAAAAGKKAGSPPRPLPFPETAEDRVREAIADDEINDLLDTVAPGWRET